MPNLKAIRNIDDETYLEFKAQAAREGRPIGEMLTDAMRAYLEHVRHAHPPGAAVGHERHDL